VVTTATGLDEIGAKETFAWNSAIKATEAITRQYARDADRVFHGSKPIVLEAPDERIYRRYWTAASGEKLMALVWEVA
jgi:hypothetical protein